ncbi:MAG: 1,4-alpha-glucan branching protein GlgB [Pseudomonadota bacterium]
MNPPETAAQLALFADQDPFAILGAHVTNNRVRITARLPAAEAVSVENARRPMVRLPGSDFFIWEGPAEDLPTHHRFLVSTKRGGCEEWIDPYSFPPQIPDDILARFGEGLGSDAYRWLGSHQRVVDGISGVNFAVWAPTAERVSVVGEFNEWHGDQFPMRKRGSSGVWELFLPNIDIGAAYRYEIRGQDGVLHHKLDPYANELSLASEPVSKVTAESHHQWNDGPWTSQKKQEDWRAQPISIYEVHLGSWRRRQDGEFQSFRELASSLVPYVSELGYTHIEIMPIAEHPFYGSWGYQVISHFCVTNRYGDADDFRYFVDTCHQAGIGVILDWVPGHFPKDGAGLARFDGSCCYEHVDTRRSEHREWGTLNFDFSRHEVQSFLLSNALFWLREFHVDGIRIDAVASMIFFDYGAQSINQWVPNQAGGRENIDAIAFLQRLNQKVHEEFPNVLTVAEESTTFPQVTGEVAAGGLGFDLKWDLGWTHDTLDYFRADPVFRRNHHEKLTFGKTYHASERFLAPISHDEVVYGKASLISKMPGDDWQKFANLRLLLIYYYTYPSKKLMFMGQEIAQWAEWNHDAGLDWHLLKYDRHQGIKQLTSTLNELYKFSPSLFAGDYLETGFDWLDCHDADRSTLAFYRVGNGEFSVIVLNMTPVPRCEYQLPLPADGVYDLICNTDDPRFGGSGIAPPREILATPDPLMGREFSTNLLLPPLAGLILKRRADTTE